MVSGQVRADGTTWRDEWMCMRGAPNFVTKARAGSVDPLRQRSAQVEPANAKECDMCQERRTSMRRSGRLSSRTKCPKGARDHDTNSELLNTDLAASLTAKIGDVHAKRAEAWPQGAQPDSALASFDKRAARRSGSQRGVADKDRTGAGDQG